MTNRLIDAAAKQGVNGLTPARTPVFKVQMPNSETPRKILDVRGGVSLEAKATAENGIYELTMGATYLTDCIGGLCLSLISFPGLDQTYSHGKYSARVRQITGDVHVTESMVDLLVDSLGKINLGDRLDEVLQLAETVSEARRSLGRVSTLNEIVDIGTATALAVSLDNINQRAIYLASECTKGMNIQIPGIVGELFYEFGIAGRKTSRIPAEVLLED